MPNVSRKTEDGSATPPHTPGSRSREDLAEGLDTKREKSRGLRTRTPREKVQYGETPIPG